MKPIEYDYSFFQTDYKGPVFVRLRTHVGRWHRAWTSQVPYTWERRPLRPHHYQAMQEILHRKFLRFIGAA